MNRGSGRRIVFRDDSERAAFVGLVAEIEAEFGVEIHAYCLMGNHFHLLVYSTRARLSDAMQWLLANFTRIVNQRRQVDGPIFRGRFHSVPVTRDAHHRWLVRYIHANPLDLGWTDPLAEYGWSSLGALLGHRISPEWLHVERLRGLFGSKIDRLERFVESARQPEPINPPVVQPGAPAAADLPRLIAAAEIARRPGPTVYSDDVVRGVSITLAADWMKVDLDDLADCFDLGRPSLRRSLNRWRRRFEGDGELARYAAHVREIFQLDIPRQQVSDTECLAGGDGRFARHV